jgi:hypothetical protein
VVDFNKEGTVTTPSWEILKFLAMEKRENLNLSIEFYYKNKYTQQETGDELSIIRARLWCLYYELKAWMERVNKEEAEQVKKWIQSKTESEIFSAVDYLLMFMDKQNLTKIDTRKVYNKSIVGEEDAVNNM